MALSDTWLKSNNGKLREATQVVNDRDGLSVRISPKGKIVFQMRYRFNNASKRMDIGTYPMMSLKEARAEVLENKKELDKGRDPLQLKLKKETAYLAQPTVRQICLEFFETAAAHKAACKDDKRAFELHVFPRLGKRICDEVTLQEWSQLLFTIVSYAKTVAIKVLGNLKLIMKWGCIHGKLKEQTLLHIRAIDLNVRKNPRTRYLTEQEIFWVIHATFLSTGISPKNKLMILMLLIFGCRVGELRTAKKSDFDFQNHTWTIPPEQHKTGARSRKAIVRPLIPQVEVLIKQAFELSPPDCEWAFPIIRAQKYKPTQKGFQTTIPTYINENVKRYFDVEMNHWTTHDLRRTMRTHIAEFAPPHIWSNKMTIFIIDGTNPIMDAVGDQPTERSITLQNNGLSDITEPFTQVLVQAGQKVTFTLIGDEAHKQLLDNLDQINSLKGNVLQIVPTEAEEPTEPASGL